MSSILQHGWVHQHCRVWPYSLLWIRRGVSIYPQLCAINCRFLRRSAARGSGDRLCTSMLRFTFSELGLQNIYSLTSDLPTEHCQKPVTKSHSEGLSTGQYQNKNRPAVTLESAIYCSQLRVLNKFSCPGILSLVKRKNTCHITYHARHIRHV